MKFRPLLATSLVCISSAIWPVGHLARAEELIDDGSLAERTFVISIDSKQIKNSIVELNKLRENQKKIDAVEVPELGISIVTGFFSEEQSKLLLSDGFREPNSGKVNLFERADCEGPEKLDPFTTADVVPVNICRVNQTPKDKSGSRVAWIIDSGIDTQIVLSSLLNINKVIDCTTSPCQEIFSNKNPDKFPIVVTVGEKKALKDSTDLVGHGTMVAGIVGGRRSGKLGIVGVAPNARINIVKAFTKNKTNLFGPPTLALKYVRDKASAGDILNLSWGVKWLEGARNGNAFVNYKGLDAILYAIADKQVRIAVASGNDDDGKGSWVQSFFPASVAPYTSSVIRDRSAPAGAIYSVSASDSSFQEATTINVKCGGKPGWCDELWTAGAFGASYSEPGVAVTSLWKSNRNGKLRYNVCTGTSFAAPGLAGMMVHQEKPSQTAAISVPIVANADSVGYITQGTPDLNMPDEPKCN